MLNPEQQDAVNTIEGPLLVLAGAGSGKTRVVTLRIIHLIETGVPSWQILGLTFTNKAAGEMKERVSAQTQHQVLICTFHSLGVRILRESIHHLGYDRDFTIYDEEDVQKLLKSCLSDMSKQDLKAMRSLISSSKNSLEVPSDQHVYNAFNLYQKKLKEYNAVDFDDLLALPVRLFEEHPVVLEEYQRRWKYLLIDEYQDTNDAQYTMVQHLVGPNQNICVVGDPDQSIYSWRGAKLHNILNFTRDYPNAKTVRLEQNYRSSSNILEAANALIGYNDKRYEKNLWSALGAGEKIKHYTANSDRGEARFIEERIRYYHTERNIPYKDMVIFYRTNAQSRAFEDCFLSARIPYAIFGGISFYQRREIKDVLAYLRMVQSSADYISFARTINLPKRGLGPSTIEKIRAHSVEAQIPIFDYCVSLINGEQSLKLTARQKQGLQNYVEAIQCLKRLQEVGSLKELVRGAIEETHYLDYLKTDQETYQDRAENLDGLIAKANEWELLNEGADLNAFLEELSLKSALDEETGEDIDRVNLMTIHHGKGLEFRVVFMAGMEEDLFPHVNSRESPDALEEERRLCYVGMTRAKEYLYLLECRQRFLWGSDRRQRRSRFITEVPNEYMEQVNALGSVSSFSYEYRSGSLAAGDRVFHQNFGIGEIQEAYQGALGLTYRVFFSKDNKERTLFAEHANLSKL